MGEEIIQNPITRIDKIKQIVENEVKNDKTLKILLDSVVKYIDNEHFILSVQNKINLADKINWAIIDFILEIERRKENACSHNS